MGRRGYRVAVLGVGLLGAGLLVADPVARIVLADDPPAALERVAWFGSPSDAAGDPGLDGPQGPSGPVVRGSRPPLDTSDLGPVLARGPQVITSDNPPSARLIPPRTKPVDNGIADTGTHSDGRIPQCTCAKKYHQSSQTGVTATPTAGRIRVSWYYIGDPAVVSFRVGYQPQTWVPVPGDPTSRTRPPITWVTVAKPAAEGTTGWTLRGATPGTRYDFFLEVEAKTPELSQPESDSRTTRFQLGSVGGVLAV